MLWLADLEGLVKTRILIPSFTAYTDSPFHHSAVEGSICSHLREKWKTSFVRTVVTLGKLHHSVLSSPFPRLSPELTRRPLKERSFHKGFLKANGYEYHHCDPNKVDTGHKLRMAFPQAV
jgi:hypothetical protein